MITGLSLAFACSFCWLVFDIARKKLSAEIPVIPLTILVMFGQMPILFLGIFIEDWSLSSADYWIPFLLGGTLNILGNVFFIAGVKYAPFSVAIPILSFTPVFTAISAFLILGERLSLSQTGGIAFVFLGGCFLILKALKSSDRSAELAKGILMMVATSILWAIVPVYDKQALLFSSGSLHAFLQCLYIGLALFIFWCLQKNRQKWRVRKLIRMPIYYFGLITAVGALILQFLAIERIEVGLVESIKRSTELFSALIVGYFIFSERMSLEKLGAIVCLALGVVLILL